MSDVRGFRVGDLDALGIQIRLELAVRRKRAKVGSATCDPKKLDSCVRTRVELGELGWKFAFLQCETRPSSGSGIPRWANERPRIEGPAERAKPCKRLQMVQTRMHRFG